MKKSITLGIIVCILSVFITLSFKSADNEKKEYVTIYYNDFNEEASLSYNNGTFKKIDYQKRQGSGDQTQILKLINEQESQGYKLINYDYKIAGNPIRQVTTVLLCK